MDFKSPLSRACIVIVVVLSLNSSSIQACMGCTRVPRWAYMLDSEPPNRVWNGKTSKVTKHDEFSNLFEWWRKEDFDD